jgi:flagellar biosynthesis component FlhA
MLKVCSLLGLRQPFPVAAMLLLDHRFGLLSRLFSQLEKRVREEEREREKERKRKKERERERKREERDRGNGTECERVKVFRDWYL